MSTYAITSPPSTNHLFATVRGRRIKSREYKAWIATAGWELKTQQAQPISGPVKLILSARANGRRDLSNHLKPVEDLLVSMSLIDSDRFKTVKEIVLRWHNLPAMLVTIEKWPAGTG